MRLVRGLSLLGIALGLVAHQALGSDPVSRPAAGQPFPATAAKPFPRDEAVVRSQVPETPPTPRPRMPSGPPIPEPVPLLRIAPEPVPAPTPTPIPTPEPPTPVVPEPAPPSQESPQEPEAETEPILPAPSIASPQAEDPDRGLAGLPRADGLDLAGLNGVPVMIGDMGPMSRLTSLASPAPGRAGARALFPWSRGFKIADNQSPQPQDRLFVSFNFFNNVNGCVNRHLGAPVRGLQVFSEAFGFEKTFGDGLASFGMRFPLNSITANQAVPGLGTHTAVGNLSLYTKLVLWMNQDTGRLISGGLALTTPTGPSTFAGAPMFSGVRDVQFQPFLGYLWRRDRWYIQGFSAINVPTRSRDVTLWYNDVGVGYFAYRNADSDGFLTAVVPTFETHVNDPLNHRGALRRNDPFATPDVVDLTLGASFILRRRGVLSLAVVDAVTGPRPFNIEAVVLYSHYFGRSRSATALPFPPVN